jgi:hypothetical protein
MKKILVFLFVALLFTGCVVSKTTEYGLVQASGDSSTEGSFFLACGSIKEEFYYIAYIELHDGALQLIRIPAKVSKIYQDSPNPYVVITDCNNPTHAEKHIIRADIHVPPNTIIQQININADDF